MYPVIGHERLRPVYHFRKPPPKISPPPSDVTGNAYGFYGSIISYKISYRTFMGLPCVSCKN